MNHYRIHSLKKETGFYHILHRIVSNNVCVSDLYVQSYGRWYGIIYGVYGGDGRINEFSYELITNYNYNNLIPINAPVWHENNIEFFYRLRGLLLNEYMVNDYYTEEEW